MICRLTGALFRPECSLQSAVCSLQMSYTVFNGMSSSNPEFYPARHCRFCNKKVSFSGTKVPRASLFNEVRNKQLVVLLYGESVMLSDVVASLGHKRKMGQLPGIDRPYTDSYGS